MFAVKAKFQPGVTLTELLKKIKGKRIVEASRDRMWVTGVPLISDVALDKVCDEEIMTNDDNLESNLLTSSLLKRRLVYMLV